ncbi:unnamed protein product [Schistosoma guineensis]|uniref:Fermitin 2 n=2 Tax=Schistosoma TaxID=6181 RepID=A0A095C4C1_SCHHA|nr:Fermitin 2 [Schistosoma haematobium]RTG87412.1 kindlin 2 [Schistosoma bovis]CAH8636325.1 unnamed protein product [Schistosoma guineensis]KAH9590627.1 Fermitin 2 [Schistosoma haematobium]CAH8659558.1 unnamed protein product [Schistosoma haematobium]CAH8665662.1 unnamed protein product [Schistosoma haematobium]
MSAYDPFSIHNGGTHTFNGTETISRMVVDGNYIDGSWELSVRVEDINTNVSVRVSGDLPLGGLMHLIVEKVKLQQSWSDHAIWWVDRNVWLLQSRTTLDQYGIQSDARLVFHRMHNDVQIVLPSLTPLVLRVNYAARLFTVVRDICKELNIRHSEELSLTLPITKNMLKTNCPLPTIRPGLRRPGLPNPRNDQSSVKSKFPSPASSIYPTVDGQKINPYNTLNSNAGTIMRFKSDNSLDQERLDFARYADCSLRRSAKAVFADSWLMKPKNLVQKARLNSGWLDSSRSLLEQGIKPSSLEPDSHSPSSPPTLYLCFKYFTFYDVILKYDAVRIHQLYEQARWSLLSGQFDCTEDEMVVFAAYQLQAELQSAAVNQHLCITNFPDMNNTNPYSTLGACTTVSSNYVNRSPVHATSSPDLAKKHYPLYNSGGSVSQLPRNLSPISSALVDEIPSNVHNVGGVDEVDELLSELEQSCGVADESEPVSRTLQNAIRPTGHDMTDTSEVPSLEGSIKVFRDRSRLLKRYKAYWAVIVEARLYLFKNKTQTKECLAEYSLRDCTVSFDVSVAHQKYIIKLSVPSILDQKTSNGSPLTPSGNSSTPRELCSTREEIWLKFDSGEQYACWLAACRLGSRGKTLASKVAYSKEVEATLELLKLQMPGPSPAMSLSESTAYLGDLTDFCNERIIRKARSKDTLRQRITEAHVNIRDLGLLEAKYKYIQTWQRLTEFGRSYFIVQFERGLLGLPNTNSGGLFSTPMDDIIAICQGRIEVVSPQTGEVLLTWNFSDLRSWNVNWDAEKVILEFRNSQVTFRPLSTNCKTIVEFIGGYVFLSQRNLEKSQEVNERLFHRLTGAND